MNLIKFIIFHIWQKIIPNSKAIFIMAHARSGSSLLEHILSSNPEILGAGEQSRAYKNKNDLIKMNLSARKSNRKYFKKYTYIIDQVLDNSLSPNIDILKEKIKFIILVRNPEESISSITHIAKKFNKKEGFDASKYYMNRITYLMNFSKLLEKDNQIFITYNELIYDTDDTLSRLNKFLELNRPLTKNYKLKNSTTKYGDPSDNIKTGTIIVTNKKIIDLEKNIRIKSWKMFEDVCSFFKTYLNQ